MKHYGTRPGLVHKRQENFGTVARILHRRLSSDGRQLEMGCGDSFGGSGSDTRNGDSDPIPTYWRSCRATIIIEQGALFNERQVD
jgi:hypothetical protein